MSILFFVINVYSVLFNMCVCHLFIGKESSRTDKIQLEVELTVHGWLAKWVGKTVIVILVRWHKLICMYMFTVY